MTIRDDNKIISRDCRILRLSATHNYIICLLLICYRYVSNSSLNFISRPMQSVTVGRGCPDEPLNVRGAKRRCEAKTNGTI